nr:transposase [Noviherbaspirillum pedocola]
MGQTQQLVRERSCEAFNDLDSAKKDVEEYPYYPTRWTSPYLVPAHHPFWPQAARRAARADRYSVRAAIGHFLGHAIPTNGMRFEHDLLASRTRLPKGWRVGQVAFRSAREAAQRRPARFLPRDCQQFVGACRVWGKTGPNSTDRGKAESKYHLVVDGNGTPLNVILTASNRHDSTQLLELLAEVPSTGGGAAAF